MAVNGVDVSVFQSGSIDWLAVERAGNGFAIAKATEGIGFVDQTFSHNWTQLAGSGLTRGAYHFARPDMGNSPQGEADFFLQTVQPQAGDMLALDIEAGSGDLAGWAQAFLSRVHDELSYWPLLYSSFSFLQDHGLLTPALTASPLWLAWPDSNGPLPSVAPWQAPTFQQYSQGSAAAGIPGPVDLDRFFGDATQLRGFAVGGGFFLDYSMKLAIVGLMYYAVLGRGPASQPEVDQWAQHIGDQGQNAWQVMQAINQSSEAQAFRSPAVRIKALEVAVAALQGKTPPQQPVAPPIPPQTTGGSGSA